jgi:hypothetical protein
MDQRAVRWCLGAGSNRRHPDFQSGALPAELPRRDLFPWGPDPAPTWRGQGFAVRQRPALRGPSGAPGKTSMFVLVGLRGFEPPTSASYRGPPSPQKAPPEPFVILVGMAGIEPATSRPPDERATAALHPVQDNRSKSRWSGQPGSNRRHSDWKSDALPSELHPRPIGYFKAGSLRAKLVPGEGFEPPRPFGHRHLRPACLPFHHPGMGMNRTGILAPQDGFEPPTR